MLRDNWPAYVCCLLIGGFAGFFFATFPHEIGAYLHHWQTLAAGLLAVTMATATLWHLRHENEKQRFFELQEEMLSMVAHFRKLILPPAPPSFNKMMAHLPKEANRAAWKFNFAIKMNQRYGAVYLTEGNPTRTTAVKAAKQMEQWVIDCISKKGFVPFEETEEMRILFEAVDRWVNKQR